MANEHLPYTGPSTAELHDFRSEEAMWCGIMCTGLECSVLRVIGREEKGEGHLFYFFHSEPPASARLGSPCHISHNNLSIRT